MKKLLCLLLITYHLSLITLKAQCVDCKEGFNLHHSAKTDHPVLSKKVSNGNSTLGISFDSTLCGLNYVQAVQNTQTRYAATKGSGFPAPDTVVGLPTFTACTHILKAYLYCEVSCKVTPTSYTITDTITNPLSVKSIFSTTLVGTSIAKCWGEVGTGTWRADVTSAISGNGVYKINFGGFTLPEWEVDGISLVIIYQDRTATYTGSFVLSDGEYTIDGGTEVYKATGFHACAASTYANAFFDVADVQNNVGPTFTASLNGVNSTFNSDFFQSVQVTTNVTNGQNSTTDSMSRPSDCYAMFIAGLYFQTTCLTCTPSSNFTFTTHSTISPCNKDSGTAKITVSDTGAVTYLWSNGSTADSIFNVGAGTYTVTITGPGGCPTFDTTVTVVPADSLMVKLSVTENIKCNGGNNGAITAITSGGRSPYTYLWSNGKTTSSINNLSIGTYSVATADSNGCAVASVLTLTQPPAMGRIATIVNPVCYGDSNGSIILNISGGTKPYTYSWSPSISTTDSAGGLKANTYIITINDSNGCGVKDTVKLTQPAKIVPIITGRDTVCTGEEDTLDVTGGGSYLWSTGSTASSIHFIAPNTHTFTVNVTVGACSSDTSFTVNVLPTPIASITAKPDTICANDSALLIAGGLGQYLWSNGKKSDSIWVKGSSSLTITLYVYVGTCVDSAKQLITINPVGNTTLTVSKDTICPYDSTTLTANGGTSYRWSNGATTSSITVSPGVQKTYTLISIVPCNIDTLVKTINITPLPKPTFTKHDSVCNGANDTITVSGGTSYLWSNGSTKTSYIIKDIKADSTISIEVFNGACYMDTTLKVGIKPPPSIALKADTICSGQCAILKAMASGSGLTYKWSNGSTYDTAVVCPGSTSDYTVTVSNGCAARKITYVQVYTPALIACCPKIISPGGADTIKADSSVNYSWSPTVKCLNPPLCDSVVASPSVTTTYTVTGTGSDGCPVEREILVTVEIICDDFTVPNVFTPNNDSRNDEFVIKTENLDKYSIIIYDRWGKEMYKSSDPSVNWNGNTEGGSAAPDGVYYYIITSTCQGNNYDKHGFVQLIR